ncbi:hypothetical protein D8S93_14595 [Vibrio sp. VGrn 2]|uniref:hypothetical protein n=1 Tax=Vibrio sp. VGrn 2 TaxID=2419839 RepID=UPI00128E4DD0|nr:hypothetical protein [Vibrio sp. VGrn 2]MPS39857.1 hypothetical protein [Vibrio sp. VGrn 2]
MNPKYQVHTQRALVCPALAQVLKTQILNAFKLSDVNKLWGKDVLAVIVLHCLLTNEVSKSK